MPPVATLSPDAVRAPHAHDARALDLTLRLEERAPGAPSHAPPSSRAGPEDTSLLPPRSLRCATCEAEISSRSQLFARTPRGPVERFVNPAGRFCELFTVRQAWGWIAVSAPTEEATWFAGHGWEIIVCARCRAHLGWRYASLRGEEPAVFFGLLCEALVER